MRFAHPEVLWFAAVMMPALGLFLIWAWRKKQRLISQFVQSRLLANLTVGVSHARQKLRLWLLFFGVGFALLALARPQWGFDWEEAHQQGLDILVAIDTSKSMLATDIAPDRLTRAKLAAFDLMKLAKSDRLGVIAFSGSAFLQCPLTLDEEAFRQSIEALDVKIIPQGGTALSEAIDTAAKAFEKSENHKVLVLFTDGEDQDSGAIETAEKAEKAGLKIFTIGVGTQEGELLRIRDENGNFEFLKDDQGNVVKSKLNESLLQQIATKAGGFYLPLVGANPIEALYNKGLAPLPKADSTTKLVRNYREQFKWPLAMAILLLTVEMFLPQRRRVRASDEITNATNAGLKKAVTAVVLFLIPLVSFASTSSAFKKYETGNYADSLAEYQKLLAKKTNDFRLYYNAGDAAYKAQLFDSAKKNFDVALQSPDLSLQQQAYYNLGNTMYQMGEQAEDPKDKQTSWESAVHDYQSALKLNPQDTEAKSNLAFVKQKLEELKKQQQQQQKQDKNDQSKQDKKDQNKDDQKQKQDQQNKQNSDQNKQDQQQNQDQQKQDSAKQDPKDQQQKQDQQQQSQQNQQNQQKQQQQQQAQQDKKDQEKKGNQQQAKEGDKDKEGEQAMQPGQVVQMTPQQAMQFLEAQKQQDRTLIFAPPQEQKSKHQNQPLKDW